MHYSLVARGVSTLAADGHLGDPFSTKIAKNRNENTVWEQVATRAAKSAQSGPKGPQNGAKISENGSRGLNPKNVFLLLDLIDCRGRRHGRSPY